MFKHSCLSVTAVIVIFVGCMVGFLLPQDAAASDRRKAPHRIVHRQATRPTLRPRTASVTRPRLSNVRPQQRVARQTRPLKVGNRQRPNSIGTHRPTFNARNPHPATFGTLPRPNSIGSHVTNRPSIRGGSHPFNVGNLARPNSIGGKLRQAGNGSGTHPLNLANLPQPNSIGKNHPHAPSQGLIATLAGHQAETGNHLHALAANHKAGGVPGAAEKVGEQKQKLNDANSNLKTAEKAAAAEKKNVANAEAAQASAGKVEAAAIKQLQDDTKSNKPKTVLANDLLHIRQTADVKASSDKALDAAKQKLASAEKAVAGDKKNVATEQKDLRGAKQTLNDKEKIASQKKEVNQLKKQQSGGDQKNPQPDDATAADSSSAATNPASSVVRSTTVAVAPVRSIATAAIIPLPVPAPIVSGAEVPTDPSPISTPPNPEVVSVIFQKDVQDADMAAFMDAYRVSVVEGPNADGIVKLQLKEPVPEDQLPQIIDSMKSQTAIVLDAAR